MVTSVLRTNRLLLLEVVMVLALIVLAIFFYLRPAAEGSVAAPLWKWTLLALLFFGSLGVRTWRRRHGSRPALLQTIREKQSKGD